MPLDTPTSNGPDNTLQVKTAFLVVQHQNGEWEPSPTSPSP
jgi:hypothetical protein